MRNNDVKIIEIRDRATLIPAFAIRMRPDGLEEKMLFNHAGYRSFTDACILLVSIEAPWHSARASDEWRNSARTMPVAHKWIEKNYDQIQHCQVVDVEFILGEKDSPSLSFWKEELVIGEEEIFIGHLKQNKDDTMKEP